MKPATRLALGVAALLVAVVGIAAAAAVISIATAQRDIGASQRRWCDTLQLLTATPISAPANPKANPSRENEYRFYQDFLRLRNGFGCR